MILIGIALICYGIYRYKRERSRRTFRYTFTITPEEPK